MYGSRGLTTSLRTLAQAGLQGGAARARDHATRQFLSAIPTSKERFVLLLQLLTPRLCPLHAATCGEDAAGARLSAPRRSDIQRRHALRDRPQIIASAVGSGRVYGGRG
jgi:hypothetical protein